MDRSGGVHSLLFYTSSTLDLLPVSRLASRKIIIEQNIKSRTGPALYAFSLLGCLGKDLYMLHDPQCMYVHKPDLFLCSLSMAASARMSASVAFGPISV